MNKPDIQWNEAREFVAKWVDRRRRDYESEHGFVDPDTGAFEFGQGEHAQLKEGYVAELAEISEGIRSLKRPLQAQGPASQVGNFGDSSNAQLARQLESVPLPDYQQDNPAAVEDLVQCEDCSGYGLIGEFTSHDYNERVCDTCACTGKVPRAQAAQQAQAVSDAEINEITYRVLGQWPSFEAQSWACKVVHAVLSQSAAPVSEQPAFPERDPSKPAEQQGIFRKFIVRRVDGSDKPGGKHYGCRYFVLDLDHDPAAPAGMRAYAVAVRATHPQLAADIEAEFGVQSAARTAGVPAVEWSEAQRVCDLPEVDEAIRNLIADQTNDNAVCVVRSILAAAPQPVAQAKGGDKS